MFLVVEYLVLESIRKRLRRTKKLEKAYKIEIKPTNEQTTKIHQTIGVCRFIYNFYIAYNKGIYEKEKKFISGISFSKWLNNEYLPNNQDKIWIKEVGSKAVKQSIMNGEKAFKKFFKDESGFPRFKKKKDQDVKVYFPKNNKTDWTIERHRVKVPTLGWVRLKEFAIYNNGIIKKNINKTRNVKKLEKKLKREQRRLSRKYESLKIRNKNKNKNINKNINIKKEGGTATKQNIQKQVVKVQKLHQRLTNIRIDYINKIVSELIEQKPSFITIEDLNVRGMMKNRHLAKAVTQQKFYEFRTKLISKAKQNSIEIRIVNRWYPSSKTCSCCGAIKKYLKLSDRVYKCECGLEIDRDLNAAINLANAKEYKIA